MKKFYFFLAISLFCFPKTNYGQSIVLGTVANFILFTSNGAVSNTGSSYLTGDIGSDVGAISGFGTSTVNGNFYSADAVTDQAKTDLLVAYNQLIAVPATVTTHAPAYGGDETLSPGVYTIAGAGSLGGIITLDAQLDSNAIFIFRFGGAYAIGATAEVVLINGARPCNIYWVAEGAISMGAAVIMKGTMIGNNSAVSMAAGCVLEGRLLSTTGAIAIDQNEASNVDLCQQNNFSLPVELLSFAGVCNNFNREIYWSTESEYNIDYFSIHRSVDGVEWKQIGDVESAGNSTNVNDYSFTDFEQFNAPFYYFLKITDSNGKKTRMNTIKVGGCDQEAKELSIYPIPAVGTLNLAYTGDESLVLSTSVSSIRNETVYSSLGFQHSITLENTKKGIYFIRVQTASETFVQKIVFAD